MSAALAPWEELKELRLAAQALERQGQFLRAQLVWHLYSLAKAGAA